MQLAVYYILFILKDLFIYVKELEGYKEKDICIFLHIYLSIFFYIYRSFYILFIHVIYTCYMYIYTHIYEREKREREKFLYLVIHSTNGFSD